MLALEATTVQGLGETEPRATTLQTALLTIFGALIGAGALSAKPRTWQSRTVGAALAGGAFFVTFHFLVPAWVESTWRT